MELCLAIRYNALIPLLVLSVLGWPATPSLATERVWTGAVNGNWSEGGNWNPSGVPQNGEVLLFYSSAAHTSMVNDLANLSCSLDFSDVDADYTLSGNALNVSSIYTAPAQAVFVGNTRTVTLNCPLFFADGGAIDVAPAPGSETGENKSLLHLNGGLTIQSGTLLIHAEGDSGRSGHVFISGALSGAGDVKVQADENNGTKGSIEFDSQSDSTNYTATLWLSTVGDAQVVFNQTAGVMVSRHVGVENGDTASLQLDQSNQNRTRLWIDPGCRLHLGGNNATFLGIVMVCASNSAAAPFLETAGGTLLGLNGNGIDVRCDDNAHTPTIGGRLNLNGANPFVIYGAATVGLEIDADIEGDGFLKSGNSTLVLNGTNTFTGTATVEHGILDVRNANALGSTGADTILNGGSLTLHTSISGKTLTAIGQSIGGDLPGSLLTAAGNNPISWDGPVVLNTNLVLIGGDINLDGPISGVGGMGLFNPGTVEVGGSSANTFTGTLLARCSLLELNKPSGTKAYAGPLVVGGGFGGPCEARWLQPYQNVGASLTLYDNGVVNLNNHNEDFGPVTFNGGEVDTGAGQFAIYQPLTVNSNSATAVINGNLGLPPNDARVFVVADGPADPDLLVNATMFGTPTYFVKQGAGTMRLANANTFSATTLLEEGILDVNDIGAMGNSVSGCVIFNGATLRFNASGTIPNNFEAVGAGAGGTHGAFETAGGTRVTLNGSILLDTNTVFNVGALAPSDGLTLSGLISGTGPLTKTGPGFLYFSGSANNTYNGDTIVDAGLLELGRNPNVVCVPGRLVVGPASAAMPAEARINQLGGFNGAPSVTVNANSLFNLNNDSETVSQLNLNDGGSVTTGAGTLNLTSGATVSVGSLNTGVNGGSHVGSSIQGNIGIPPNSAGATFNIQHYANVFPFDSAPELDVPANIFINGFEDPNFAQTGIIKTGAGRMRLGGSASFKGSAAVNSGTLQVDGPLTGFPVVNGGTLKGTGSVGPVFLTTASAAVAPGDSPGILTCGNFDHGGGSGVLSVELNGTAPGGYDQLKVNGTVNLNGVRLTGSLGFTPQIDDRFIIIANDGSDAVTGTFNGLPEGASLAIGDQLFQITYHGNDGNDVVLTEVGAVFHPQLTIERAAADSVRLLWTTNDPAFELQSVTNLSLTSWSSVSPLPVVVGTNNVVTEKTDSAHKFYRLIKP